jgi:multidrug efflux pump subunit AcrB
MINIAAIARPHFGAVVLTTALLAVGGIYCATRMPSGVYPEITFPRIAVIAKKPGLDLRTMEVQVTVPLEQAVGTVSGVERVRSKTIRGGCDISIDFSPGTDMKRAEQLTWNRIGAARSLMPADVEFTVEQMTPSVFPILSVVLTGGDNAAKLREYAYYDLAPKIKKIPDVNRCDVSGGDLREIEVEARPDDLLAAGLSAADLADQIGKVHRLQPVGRIEQPPFAFQIMVNTQGESIYDIEKLQISTKNNQPVRVGDVADVKVSRQDRDNSVGFEGKDAVVLTVFRRLGGNTVNISQGVQELLRTQPPPSNVHAELAYDQSRFINTAVDNVRDAILIGSAFSILILLLFLRSWRATLISALAIPITLSITFLFLYWIGETFNLMSLGGLAVAIGLIIDDTVVVIENIARHLAHAKASPGPAAAINPVDAASSEITGAVVGSTLTTVLVFVPLAFIAGVYGQFFASLSWSLCIAVLVSMVISLTLIPVCAAKFLAGKPMPEPGRIYNFLEHIYEAVLKLGMRFPLATLALSFAAIGVGVLLFTGLPSFAKQLQGQPPPEPLVKGLETGLMPTMDEGAFIIDYWAPTGTPLKRTQEMAADIENILSENPDVEVYVRRTGAENGLFATQTNRGDIQVILRPAENDPYHLLAKKVRPEFDAIENELKLDGKAAVRRRYRRRNVQDVMKEVKKEIQERYSENQLKVETVQIMKDELNDMSGADRPVEVKLFGPDYVELRKLAGEIAETLETKGKGRGIEGVNSNVFAGNPDLPIKVDGAQAARLGLTTQEVERQLLAMYSGQIATQVRESAQRMIDVRVRYPNALRFGLGRFDPELLRNQLILVPEGANPTDPPGSIRSLDGARRAVPLSAVASVEPTRNPDEESRENQQPAIFITADLKEDEAGLGSVVADIRQWMTEMTAEGKLPKGYRWELGGHYLRYQEATRSFLFVMVVAILLVFILLCFQFRSVVLPFLIFLTQPLSLVSGLFALWITGTPLNVSSFMGVILLIGLDMKNGILLVEYIQRLRKEGMELRPALLLAGRTRFRPILMTSLAAILGLLPLALGIGPGAQMQQPLAILVIGGLTANMLFTRMVIPVGYLVPEALSRLVHLPGRLVRLTRLR